MKLLEFTKKSSTNNYKQYRKLIQYFSKRNVNKLVSFLNAAVVCNTSEFWRVYLSAWLPQRSGHTSFLTLIFHKVV